MKKRDLAIRDSEGRRLCPKCGAPVAEKDEVCPLCGAPLWKRTRRRFPFAELALLLVLLVGGLWWKQQPGLGAPAQTATMPPTPTFTPTPTATSTPTVTPTPTATPTPKLIYHKVQPGENLSIIAAEYGVSVQEIVKANNLPSAQFIRVGDKLLIPKGYIPPTPTPEATRALALNYIVQQGDTLGFISLSFHVPIPTLMAVNHLTSTKIHPGDVILIPESDDLQALTPTPFVGPAPITPKAAVKAPTLLTPADGDVIGAKSSPFLSWTFDGWLGESRWYHLRVWKEGSALPVVDILTKATSWRMPLALREESSVLWKWQVEIVHSDKSIEGTPVPGSPIPDSGSAIWHFTW
jgi:LysM repeat protein